MVNTLQQIKDKAADMTARINDLRRNMREEAKGWILQACQGAFETCPEIEQFHWVQYTPYFNDGDACYFSVHEINFQLVGDEDVSYYESSEVPTEDTVRRCKEELESCLLYENDKHAWLKNYWGNRYEELVQKQDRYMLGRSPWQTSGEAREKLERVTEASNRIGDRAEIIDRTANEICRFIGSIPSETMNDTFGDHVSVVIRREGIEVDSYDHD